MRLAWVPERRWSSIFRGCCLPANRTSSAGRCCWAPAGPSISRWPNGSYAHGPPVRLACAIRKLPCEESDMKRVDPAYFHKMYGVKSSRLVYRADDFLDYVLMILLTWLVASLAYGFTHPMAILVLGLSTTMIAAFLKRHGCELRAPAIVKRPQDILYMLVYKLQNIRAAYLVAAAVLLLENYLVYLTP